MLSSNDRSDTGQSLDLRTALKRRQILDGARQVFLLNGYAGASMEEITARAGVSKGSIYHHFDNKDALFGFLIRAEAERIARVLPAPDPNDPDPASALRPLGVAVLETLDNPATIATLRLIIGALGQFPHLGEAFLQDSLGPTVERITVYLDDRSVAGVFRIDDSRALAEGFARRCLAQAMERVLVTDPPHRTDAERSAVVEEALWGLALAIPSDQGE